MGLHYHDFSCKVLSLEKCEIIDILAGSAVFISRIPTLTQQVERYERWNTGNKIEDTKEHFLCYLSTSMKNFI